MIEHFIFISYIFLFIFSLIGYGLIFSNLFEQKFLKLNLGYIGIIGIFFSILVSVITSYFYAHNYTHNLIFHTLGLVSFLFFFNRYIKKDILHSLVLLIIMISGIYIFKNHDDFPYYHLTYSLNLSENSFVIGTGLFGHGFRTPSSIFYYHSLLYMPGIKFFLFHSGPFFILYFFNLVILKRIFFEFKNKKFSFIYFFGLLSFIFVNIVFYRLGEHGTDRSSQILLILIFLIFFEIIYLEKDSKLNLINLFFLIIVLAASIKVLYYIYLSLAIFLFLEKKINLRYFFKRFSFMLILFLFFSAFISKSFFSTGCIIYPAEKTCFEKMEWSISKETVNKMSIHYEWWAKAGGGPNYKHELSKKEYIKNFNWVNNWFKKHFFGKVSDTLGAIFLISFVTLLLFKGKIKKKINRKNYKIYCFIPILFLLEWFLNHPSMRYGGYILFALPVFIILSRYLEENTIEYKKIYFRSFLLIIITLVTYNIRNIDRISKEVDKYDYKIFSSPYFYVPDVKSELIINSPEIFVYKPINNMCWASKTPCSYNSNIQVKNYLWMKMINSND